MKNKININLKSYGIFLLLIFSATLLQAQNKTDSLFHILSTKDLNESEQSILYSEIAKAYLRTDLDSARIYATKGLLLAERSEYIDGVLKNTITLGDIALRKDSLIEASNIYIKATEISKYASDKNSVLNVWLLLGYTHDLLSDYDRSLEYYFTGLHIADSLKLTTPKSTFYNNIAIIHNKIGNYRKAIDYYFKAASILKEIDKEYYYANTLLNIGNVYISLNSIDTALIYLNKSKKINERINNHYGLLNYYANIGEIELRAGAYEKALISFNHELKEINKLDESFFGSRVFLKTAAYLNLGDVYLRKENYEKAIDNYNKVIRLATKSSFLEEITSAYEGLSHVYEKINKSDSALVYYKLFQKYNDSLKREETIKKISELEMDYKLLEERKLMQLEKERMESRQKVKRLIYLLIIGASISGLLIFLLLFIHQKDKHLQSQLKEQNLAKELEYKNKELTTNVMYLLKKNEFISEISNKLKVVDSDTIIVQPKIIADIINELDKNSSNKVWTEFETRFQDIYGDFYKRLNERFPAITPNELKLCAFLKLNMSTKEISSITYQSTETLKKARFRLRKKLGLNRDENLMAFLNQV